MNRILIALFTLSLLHAAGAAEAAEPRRAIAPTRTIPAQVAPAAIDWSACRKAAASGSAMAIAGWQQQAVLKAVVVNGPAASGGIVSGPALQPLMESMMTAAGVPAAVAKGFAAPVSDAWRIWVASLRVPGLNWYPAFSCFAGPAAPPTPNVPMPLVALAGNSESLSAAGLKAAIRQALGPQAQDPQAMAAIEGFADDFALRFTRYLTSVKVTNVMANGPVPAYAPPYGPKCGPVVGGSGNMMPGGFVGAW